MFSFNLEIDGCFLLFSVVCSLYEVKPSQNDLVDHLKLIGEAVKSYDSLAKSKVCM